MQKPGLGIEYQIGDVGVQVGILVAATFEEPGTQRIAEPRKFKDVVDIGAPVGIAITSVGDAGVFDEGIDMEDDRVR